MQVVYMLNGGFMRRGQILNEVDAIVKAGINSNPNLILNPNLNPNPNPNVTLTVILP
jgi:hypothetical protein